MKKRKDECQFCTSRTCNHRIVREEEPKYDEVYCCNHSDEAESEADRVLGNPGHMRSHLSGNSKYKRGEPLSNWK